MNPPFTRSIMLLLAVLLANTMNAQEIRLQIVNTKGEPQFGVYVVNPKNHYLLTSSDIDGECILNTDKLAATDSLQFQGMGYQTVVYHVKDLLTMHQITLTALEYELDETVVKGITMKELLKEASSKLKKYSPDFVPLCKFYGKGLYEKITQCLCK